MPAIARVVTAVAAATIIVWSAIVRGENAPPAASMAGDSLCSGLIGLYAEFDSGGIGIVEIAVRDDSVEVRSGDSRARGRCSATGFVGWWHRVGPATTAPGRGSLRLSPNPDGSLSAHYSDEDTTPPHDLAWLPVTSGGRRMKTLAEANATMIRWLGSPAAGDSLPRLGDSFYLTDVPTASSRVAPVYPPEAIRHGVQGTVLVEALIDRSGTMVAEFALTSIPELDEAALDAVAQWRFSPAMANGVKVGAWVVVPIKFTLH